MARQVRLHKTVTAIGVCCLILFTPSVSLAWGPEAHKIVAQIAWEQLQPSTKKKIIDLLLSSKALRFESAGNKAFVDASTWADDIRAKRPELNAEHFLERPFPVEGKAPEPNLITALKKNLELLQTSPDINVRVEALKFIIHYVGDIHQPLHCATRKLTADSQGDFGGNLVLIQVADASGKVQRISLHNYWDSGLDSFSGPKFNVARSKKSDIGLDSFSGFDVASSAKAIAITNPDAKPTSASDLFDFQAWADESFRYATDYAYAGIKTGTRVTPTYKSKGVRVVNRQLARAGFRLANLLDASLAQR